MLKDSVIFCLNNPSRSKEKYNNYFFEFPQPVIYNYKKKCTKICKVYYKKFMAFLFFFIFEAFLTLGPTAR